jgi:hypothetical protein
MLVHSCARRVPPFPPAAVVLDEGGRRWVSRCKQFAENDHEPVQFGHRPDPQLSEFVGDDLGLHMHQHPHPNPHQQKHTKK